MRIGQSAMLDRFYLKKATFRILCSRRFYGAPLNDGTWHCLCVTWQSSGGAWSVYVDGKTNPRRSGTKFRNNHVLEFHDEQLVLGQEIQDDAFNVNRAFMGNMSRVNMWDYSMSENEIQIVGTNCSTPVGNVLKWRDFWKSLRGSVHLSGKSKCTGAGEPALLSSIWIITDDRGIRFFVTT